MSSNVTGIWDDEKGAFVSPDERFGYCVQHTIWNQVDFDEFYDEIDASEYDAEAILAEACEYDCLEGTWHWVVDDPADFWRIVSEHKRM